MHKFIQSSIGRLRVLAFLEGSSLLLLLFIAMPLKYLWHSPKAVEVIGMAHGVLFIAFIVYTVYIAIERNWKFVKETLPVLISSFLPFGTFYIDYRILSPKHKLELQERVL